MSRRMQARPGGLGRKWNAIGAVVMVNLLLAIFALTRDICVASYLGTTSQADALLLAYFLPDTVGNVLIAAAVGVSCVPVFSKLLIREEYLLLNKCTKNVNLSVLVLSLILFTAFYLFRNQVIDAVGSGLTTQTRSLCLNLYLIMLPTLLLSPLTAVGGSLMQVHNRFIIPALAPVLFNVVFLGAALYALLVKTPVTRGIYLLAFSITVGIAVMFITVWGSVITGGLLKRQADRLQEAARITALGWKGLREITGTFIPYILILLSTQSILYAERYLASFLEVGSIAGLNYAYRLAQFPLWVFVAAVNTVILPAMSRASGLGRTEELQETLKKALGLVLVITLPLSYTFYFWRYPIISVLLKRGAFDESSLQITAGILAGYSLAVVGQGLILICLRVFLAVGKLGLPLAISVFSAIINISLDFYLVGRIGSAGLGYGAAWGSIINALAIFYFLHREINLNVIIYARQAVKILCANIPLFFLVILYGKLWTLFLQNSAAFEGMAYIAAAAFSCAAVYLLSMRHFKII